MRIYLVNGNHVIIDSDVRAEEMFPGQWQFIEERIIAPSVPQSVTMRQGREVLIDMGLLASVDTIIAAIPDATQRAKAENYFNMSNTMERQNSWVKSIGAALGLTETQLDEMFIEASKL
jgi:hypothetical protein